MTISTYEKVKIIFCENAPAATVYRQLRHTFATEIVRGSVGNLKNDQATMPHAHKQAWAAKDAAYALIVGLMSAANCEDQAQEAAAEHTNLHFDQKALLLPPTSQPRRIYSTLQDPDAYTLSIAPERVLGTVPGMTMYLLSEDDAQMFTQRTGEKLRPLHTL
ncbi:hypothetical protein [Deinococcus marmoris]|uniref:hypothetical protein n=1 Tax=Deinococcus marmoris TaxID=249408 RepID=UPI000494E068|nr:hypothetical protein [Deinococcus marmoris]